MPLEDLASFFSLTNPLVDNFRGEYYKKRKNKLLPLSRFVKWPMYALWVWVVNKAKKFISKMINLWYVEAISKSYKFNCI